MVEVTDPEILRQLNAEQPSAPGVPVPVTDPAILAQLNTETQKPGLMEQLGQTWPARMAKDIYSYATLPGDVYAGKTQVDPNSPEFMHRAIGLAGVAPVGMLPSAMAAAPSVKQLVQTGGKQIEEAVNSGLIFDPTKIKEGIETIRKGLPNPRVAEDTHAALNEFEKKIESGQPVTFNDIKIARDELLDVQANAARSSARTAATDLRGATIAKHGIDDLVRGTPEGEQFIAGNANVTAGKQAETLDKRLYKSELRAGAVHSGKNVGNTIRSNVASMLLAPKESRGMTPEIRQQAENLVYGTGPENLMRHWGNVLGGGGGLGQALTAAGGAGLGFLATGNPVGAGVGAAVAPVAGSLLKHGANEAAISHLDALSNALRGNSPLGDILNRGNYFAGTSDAASAAKAALIRALMSGTGQQPTQP